MQPAPVDEQIAAAVKVMRSLDTADVQGMYLYGSAVAGGLRPDSDIDLFAVTARPLLANEKRQLVLGLMPISGRDTRPAGWRPLEVTVVARPEVQPWRYPPRCELQYGEWLRADFAGGNFAPWPPVNPDLAVLVTMVREGGITLQGPPADQLLNAVPRADLMRAMVDELPQLLADLQDDTRNVLLTLARMWSTVETGRISSKDAAAEWVAERLPREHRALMDRARALYLEGGYGSWGDEMGAVTDCAHLLAERIRFAAPG